MLVVWKFGLHTTTPQRLGDDVYDNVVYTTSLNLTMDEVYGMVVLNHNPKKIYMGSV